MKIAPESRQVGQPKADREALPKRLRILLVLRYYRRRLHEGVAAYCREHRWVLDSLDHSPDLSYANQWDGIIMLHQSIPDLQGLVRKHTPLVTLAMDEKGGIFTTAVLQDQEAIGVLGARHLLERGFRRLVFCGYRDAISHTRFRGMRAEAQRHGAAYREVSVPHRAPATKGPDFMLRWLGAHLLREQKPFAVLAAHDLLGVAVEDACRMAGLKMPQEVAVLGVDNDEIICDCAYVPLSSVDNNLFQHGYEAAKLLGRLMRGEKPPDRPILIPPRRVVVRTSTDTLAAEDPQLAAILLEIHEQFHACEFSVKHLCDRFGLSRRALGELFARENLKPPGHVIHDLRLRKACLQLGETTLRIKDIAATCGFSSVRSFCRFFRQRQGTSPEAWRKQTRA